MQLLCVCGTEDLESSDGASLWQSPQSHCSFMCRVQLKKKVWFCQCKNTEQLHPTPYVCLNGMVWKKTEQNIKTHCDSHNKRHTKKTLSCGERWKPQCEHELPSWISPLKCHHGTMWKMHASRIRNRLCEFMRFFIRGVHEWRPLFSKSKGRLDWCFPRRM